MMRTGPPKRCWRGAERVLVHDAVFLRMAVFCVYAWAGEMLRS